MSVYLPAEFNVQIDHTLCRRCRRCVAECGFGTLSFKGDKVVADHKKCVACQRCVSTCPEAAINVVKNPLAYKENHHWTPEHIKNLHKQAATGGMLLTGGGNDKVYKSYFDHMVLDACQVTNPSIDPLREPMELRTYLGSKPDSLEFRYSENGEYKLKTKLNPQVKLDTPIVFSAMSYGAISLNAHKALASAAKECGILYNTGEGGLHKELYCYGENTIVQVASGRFGVNQEYLNRAAVVEIKCGQGAKPGIGGHLPGEKVNREVSQTRMIPEGSDAISPAPHHDIYSIEDLAQLIYAIKEATGYEKPVSVKIAAVHNVAAIASGIARAGADIIYLDGFRGGTGAAPTIIRDNVGIPIEIALAAVDDRLRKEGIRNKVSIIASGGIRSSADMAKAIALGADAVAVGTAALIAMGCRLCQKCYTGSCSWGIATQRPELVRRLNPDKAAQCLINMIRGWSLELKEILGALGVNAVESLRGSRERLRGIGLNETELNILGIKPAGR
ncbi:glutamate synthase domain-containing protein 2 [Desulfohalotomaculum tongense]|uniref:glutamate synthase-related protein n=1 Tax=Desulforadius tongensis TaxID=1216062 RepID=UPI00195A800E|nr:glutamate synthase-related protein [Desulforadius tongensis]MBM7855367.1 glutamate synthase domain-containing protein 2 [Desulforadius tongensis]